MLKFISFLFCSMFCLKGFTQADSLTSQKLPITTYSFYMDGYIRSDFAKQNANNKTSFTNTNNTLALGMLSLKVDHSWKQFSGTMDLGMGKRADEFSYNDQGFLQKIKQFNLSYAPNANLKFTVGKWATHIGYEMVDAYLNRNYSMSYGFSYGPFFHTGFKADIVINSNANLTIGLAQPTDFVQSNSPQKIFIAQYSYISNNAKWKSYLNFQGGKDKAQFDFIINHQLNKQASVNYDGTLANLSGLVWTSNALYFNYDPISQLGFTWRSELFNDRKNALGLGTSILQNTLSANWRISKFIIIPEFRWDNAKDKIFLHAAGTNTSNASNFLIAAVYKW